eukprot:6211222-Pleurochrysis_carterae.AAC.3
MPFEAMPNASRCAEMPVTTRSTRQLMCRCPDSNWIASLLVRMIRPTYTVVRGYPPPREIESRALSDDSRRAEQN